MSRAERRGLLLAFAGFGSFWGTWSAVLPDLREQAGLRDGQLGLAPAWERLEGQRLMAAAHGCFSLGILLASVATGVARDLGASPLAVLGATAVTVATVALTQPGYRRAAVEEPAPVAAACDSLPCSCCSACSRPPRSSWKTRCSPGASGTWSAASARPPGSDLALVTALGYLGFVTGPPVMGLLSSVTSLPTALALLAVLSAAMAVVGPLALRKGGGTRCAQREPGRGTAVDGVGGGEKDGAARGR